MSKMRYDFDLLFGRNKATYAIPQNQAAYCILLHR